MSYQLKFKNNYLGTVFQITKGVWLNVLLAYLMTILITGILVAVAIWSFAESFVSPFIQNNGSILKNSIPFNSSLFPSMLWIIGLMLFFVPISIFLSAWHYNFSFIAVNSKIQSNNLKFKEIFKKSFNTGVLKIILIAVFFIILAFYFL